MLFSEEFINITFFVLLTVADKIPEAAAIIILAAIGIMMSSLAVELGIALENRGYQKTSVRVTRLLVQSQEPDN